MISRSRPLASSPNINTLWAELAVEECCRLGASVSSLPLPSNHPRTNPIPPPSQYFCIAPGSRSSPLALAVASNPRARLVVCIDERSLAYHAVGFGRGRGKPAVVITSSGTAVSNLYPAVVEASEGQVPLLLLTADRPHELRDSGANQTIHQVKGTERDLTKKKGLGIRA